MHFIQHITGHNSIAHWPFIPCVPLLVIFTKGGTIPFVYFIVSVADSVPPSPMGNRVKNGPEMHLLTKIRLILYCFFGNGCELSVVDVQVFNVMYLKCKGNGVSANHLDFKALNIQSNFEGTTMRRASTLK